MPNSRALSVVLGIVGVAFLALALLYFSTPANALPGFVPGADASITRHHNTHGIAAVLVALVSFVGAWMTGPRRTGA